MQIILIIYIFYPCMTLQYLSEHPNNEALSQPVAVLLLVAITVILAALVLLLIHLPSFDLGLIGTPSIFQILCVYHQDEKGRLNYDSQDYTQQQRYKIV